MPNLKCFLTPIGHIQIYHNTVFGPYKIIHIQALFSISLGAQDKLKTVLMQNFGGTKEEYYGKFESGPKYI